VHMQIFNFNHEIKKLRGTVFAVPRMSIQV
jgi:hypothetical protein